MRLPWLPLVLTLFPLALVAQSAPDPLSGSRQVLVVTTSNWDATSGVLRRFEQSGAKWQPVGRPIPVVVGRSGVAWGRGLHPMPQSGPQKREGDGKSPAGVFRLPYAFGYAARSSVPEIKLPYVQCTATVECVDDKHSVNYNTIVDRALTPDPDWHSSEKMRMTNNQYQLGVFVAHNSDPSVPGDGSCVFLHIWKGPDIPTSGCTAMTLGSIETVLGWLDPAANPLLVQLPADEYRQLQMSWRLPALAP